MGLKLSNGLSDFRGLIEDGYRYIDKTKYLHQLCTTGKFYFLSRPRRFGKSLMLTTLQEIYLGRKELFKGLWIEDQWDWNKKHPVIRLSLKTLSYHQFGLIKALTNALHDMGRTLQVEMPAEGIKDCFVALLKALYEREGKVVVLIDEYDAPILDYLGTDTPQALENRQILREFYTTLKEYDPLLECVMLTGVTKFSRVGIFSD